MKIVELNVKDALLFESPKYVDQRGYFFESYNEKTFRLGCKFVQDNHSSSTRNVLRGLHYQLPPFAQSKLVRVIEGRVLDVAVDIRQSSPTFGQYVSTELSSDNHHQLFIPRGFAHGFVVLSESAVFAYKVDNYYSPADDRGIAFDDKEIGIDWVLKSDELQLSDKDKSHPVLSKAKELF